MAAKDEPGPGECNGETGARLLKMTPQHFNQLKRQGVFKVLPGRKNVYQVIAVVHAYIGYLQDENRRTTKSAAASAVQQARADQIRQQIAKDQRDLIPADEVCDWIVEAVGAFRAELSGVPAAISREPEIRAIAEKVLDDAIERIRRSFAVVGGNVRSRRPLVVETEETEPA